MSDEVDLGCRVSVPEIDVEDEVLAVHLTIDKASVVHERPSKAAQADVNALEIDICARRVSDYEAHARWWCYRPPVLRKHRYVSAKFFYIVRIGASCVAE